VEHSAETETETGGNGTCQHLIAPTMVMAVVWYLSIRKEEESIRIVSHYFSDHSFAYCSATLRYATYDPSLTLITFTQLTLTLNL
jgi:hypothetical protein